MTMTNRQAVLADTVRREVERYRRGSLEAHRGYLAAGAALVEAREAAKRGEWSPFIEACGIEERTAQRMMKLAKSGAKPVTVSAFGGVKGLLVWLAVGERIKRGLQQWDTLFPGQDEPWPLVKLLPMTTSLWLLEGDLTGTVDAHKDAIAVREAYSAYRAAIDWSIQHIRNGMPEPERHDRTDWINCARDRWQEFWPDGSRVVDCAALVQAELILIFGQGAKREGADTLLAMQWWMEGRGREALGEHVQDSKEPFATGLALMVQEHEKTPRYLHSEGQKAMAVCRYILGED